MISAVITVEDYARRVRARFLNPSGQSMVEYALIVASVALMNIIAMKLLTPHVNATYNQVGNCLDSSLTPVTGAPTPSC
jgi:Flp pilus assembly pilin Flp